PVLVTLLGGTFGNMDEGETSFLNNIKARLNPGDCILIDVPIKGKDWSIEKDSRAHPEHYSEAFRRLLCSGLGCRLGMNTHQLVEEFGKRVDWKHEMKEAASLVDDTDAVRIIDKESQLTMLRFCRYSWPYITDWVRTQIGGFNVMFSERTPAADPDIVG